jgi:cytochrome P450
LTASSKPITGTAAQPYPFGAAAGLDLHPRYRQLREEEPLTRVQLPYGEEAWLVTRHDDLKVVYGDARFSRAESVTRDHPRTIPDLLPLGILDMDPPEHTRLRRLIAKAFTTRRIEQLRPRIEQIASELVTAMLAAGPPADLVPSLALPLPIAVICELLGVPYEDRGDFVRWTDESVSLTLTDQERAERFGGLHGYIAGLVERRRREPTDDLLGELITARDEDDRLSEEELTTLAVVLLGAGYETTANQLANFVYLLLTHPDQHAALRRQPELVADAVEELLRFTPLQTNALLPRYARTDVELSGGTVAAGEAVLTYPPAANRDPRVFADPDRLDITRRATAHLGFGHGPHHCVGASLARAELQIAMGLLLDRLPGLRLAVAPDEVRWKASAMVRGPAALPIAW